MADVKEIQVQWDAGGRIVASRTAWVQPTDRAEVRAGRPARRIGVGVKDGTIDLNRAILRDLALETLTATLTATPARMGKRRRTKWSPDRRF